jgi:hypothetical protein
MATATLLSVRSARSVRLLADVNEAHGRDTGDREPVVDRLAQTLGREFADRLVAALSREALDRLEAALTRDFADRIAALANERQGPPPGPRSVSRSDSPKSHPRV